MSYQVLARKWRPKSFRERVGQEHVLQALVNALDHDRLHHAYLFTGTRGVGKTTIARILAKCLNCETGVSSQPCGQCSSCLEIAEGRSVDLLEVDAASRTKVEDTRELLENVQYAPTRSRYKVYLIDEVHMLSNHSFNALLKTLEEPPPHVKFLLATTDPQKLPATVLSRCLQFNLKNMPPEQVVSHLTDVLGKESIPFEEPALWLLGRAASGSMRDALSLTDQAIAFGSGQVREQDVRSMLGSVDLSFVYQLMEAISANDPAQLLAAIEHMAEHAPDYAGSLDELLSLLHRVTLAQVVPDAIDNSWGDAEQVRALAKAITAEDTQLFYQVGLNGKRDLPLSPDPRQGFEMILLRMIAFRPAVVLDDSIDSARMQEVANAVEVAPEGGPAVKKRDEAMSVATPPASAPLPVVPPPSSEPSQSTSQSNTQSNTQVATPPPQQTPTTRPVDGQVPLASLEPGGWPGLLENLGLTGIVYNIASHCTLTAVEGTHLAFVLDESNAGLFNPGHAQKLQLALENYFDQSLSVEVTPGAPEAETPAQIAVRQAAERQREAVAAIESDAQLQALITRFDGELDRSSITPNDA